jgi:hypothetical protein|tara:strand:+ start:5757 stop:6119 length:363 start_codon:yes stop_codon:yes gene_type:complete
MSYQIRKVERYTNWEATQAVDIDPNDFKDLASFPYKGNSETDFVEYIQELYYEDWYEICEELESEGRLTSSDALATIFEGEMEIYSSSTEKEERSWIELGEIDESYSKYGGFNQSASTLE